MRNLLFVLLLLPAGAVAIPYDTWDTNAHGDLVGYTTNPESAVLQLAGQDPVYLFEAFDDGMGLLEARALYINDARWVVGEIITRSWGGGTGYAIWNPAGERVLIPDEVLDFYPVGGGDSGVYGLTEDGWACTAWGHQFVDWNVHTGQHRAGSSSPGGAGLCLETFAVPEPSGAFLASLLALAACVALNQGVRRKAAGA